MTHAVISHTQHTDDALGPVDVLIVTPTPGRVRMTIEGPAESMATRRLSCGTIPSPLGYGYNLIAQLRHREERGRRPVGVAMHDAAAGEPVTLGEQVDRAVEAERIAVTSTFVRTGGGTACDPSDVTFGRHVSGTPTPDFDDGLAAFRATEHAQRCAD